MTWGSVAPRFMNPYTFFTHALHTDVRLPCQCGLSKAPSFIELATLVQKIVQENTQRCQRRRKGMFCPSTPGTLKGFGLPGRIWYDALTLIVTEP
jgi:hypothetical protein